MWLPMQAPHSLETCCTCAMHFPLRHAFPRLRKPHVKQRAAKSTFHPVSRTHASPAALVAFEPAALVAFTPAALVSFSNVPFGNWIAQESSKGMLGSGTSRSP